ncbi:potassium voltage-gated channel protein Shaw-like [Mizuhopecten yessoensis]|uniref:Potassium voltage-gated channel protein Shaw n=1 Tax=Mizuhopecten yessoensis TaxID=6573 RepID=A0A210PQI3_MIZYE|nr:potassium voltage-gated channel protein Shaw-like [Mizuhopecten yessoensis]OWF38737.1 Potassium voltage-gated channel protein Shaw [Mizuhopecten yessoensis]
MLHTRTNASTDKPDNFAMPVKGRDDGKNRGILAALLPGAKIQSDGKVVVSVGTTRETVIFNVGGTRFETYKSTLKRQPDFALADENFLRKHFRKDVGDYFFDRDPDMFKSILNYLRTGELHLPSNICGPAAKAELAFWKIQDDLIERCCWTDYNSWNATVNALNQLEHDRKGSLLDSTESEEGEKTTWTKWRPRLWMIINDPASSRTAKIYGWISLMVVAVSIFSFMAETHPSFSYSLHRNIPTSSSNGTAYTNYSDVNGSVVPVNVSTSTGDVKTESVTHPVLAVIDIICLAFFTVEFICRLCLSRRRLQYLTSLMGVIDLLALIPDYIELIVYNVNPELQFDGSVDFISVLRITRVLRIFRLVRHVPGLWILIYTLRASFKELLLMSAFLLVGMLVFSSLIYYVDDHKIFTSIPHGFWWAIITMTTVGYGDMYPTTNLGYLVGSFCALSGLLMIGFSVPVLVNNFIMYYKHVQFALEEEHNKKVREKEASGGLLGMMTKGSTGRKECSPETVPLNSLSPNRNNQGVADV